MTQDDRTTFSLRELLLFTAAVSVVLFVSSRSGHLLPFVLSLGIALTIFAACNRSWLYLWLLLGGLLVAALFYVLANHVGRISASDPGMALMFVLGAYLGLAAATRKLGLIAIGSLFVILGTFTVL